MIITLIKKDLTLFMRNRFFAFITVLGLVAYAIVYFVMPSELDESFEIALYAPNMPQELQDVFGERGIDLNQTESEVALREAVADNEFGAGVVLSDEVMAQLATGQETTLTVYFSSETPEDINDALETLLSMTFNDISYRLSGQPLNIVVEEEILGHDLLGQPIAIRDRMLPLFAVFLLMTETLALSSLIAEEREGRTLQALLITPLNMRGLFVSKGIMGVIMAFGQAVLLMVVTGGLAQQPLLMLVALLLGSIMVTGLAFLIAAAAKDLLSVLAWGILALLLLTIPAFTVLFPGAVTDWIKLVPSFYLIDTVHQVVNFGASWDGVGFNLIVLLVTSAVFFALGTTVLGRKVQ